MGHNYWSFVEHGGKVKVSPRITFCINKICYFAFNKSVIGAIMVQSDVRKNPFSQSVRTENRLEQWEKEEDEAVVGKRIGWCVEKWLLKSHFTTSPDTQYHIFTPTRDAVATTTGSGSVQWFIRSTFIAHAEQKLHRAPLHTFSLILFLVLLKARNFVCPSTTMDFPFLYPRP